MKRRSPLFKRSCKVGLFNCRAAPPRTIETLNQAVFYCVLAIFRIFFGKPVSTELFHPVTIAVKRLSQSAAEKKNPVLRGGAGKKSLS